MTRTEGISPWKSNKDAASASCKKKKKKKKIKPASQHSKVRKQQINKPASQQASKAESQQSSKPTGPSVRVSRAETRLTVYRSAYIRMLVQLVASFLVERLIILFHKKMMLLRSSTWKVGCEPVFQKHCIVKFWLEVLDYLTQLTNEKIYNLPHICWKSKRRFWGKKMRISKKTNRQPASPSAS